MRLVEEIFANNEDLLEGFYQFLPDKRTQHQAARLDELLNRSKLDAKTIARRKVEGQNTSGSSTSVPQKRKRKIPEKEPLAKAGPSKVRFLTIISVIYSNRLQAPRETYETAAE